MEGGRRGSANDEPPWLLLVLGTQALFEQHVALLAKTSSWRVGWARDGADALCRMDIETPALFIASADSPPPGPGGMEVCRQLKRRSTGACAIILVPQHSIEVRLEAFEAQADDCLEEPFDPRELAARLNALIHRCALPPLFGGECQSVAFGPSKSSGPVVQLEKRVTAFGNHYKLSAQEQKILVFLAGGVDPKAIGPRLGCTHATVRTHLGRIARKLGCSGTREILTSLLVEDYT